ncbi:MAG: flagellar hook-associated protein FlgL [Pontibacterium sp.]
MRVSTRQNFLQSVQNMQNSQNRLATLQNQISTGKRIDNPSDDPVAAAQLVKLNRELAQTEKYQENIEITQRRLELQDTVLDSVGTANDRMQELIIQGRNDTLTAADRKTIATELRELAEYTSGLMNTQDAQGEYLFAGNQGFTQPYQQNAQGEYDYHGDDGRRSIQVAPVLYVPATDSGEYLFEAATDRLDVELRGQAIADGDTFMTVPSASSTFDTDFASRDIEAQYLEAVDGLGDLTLTVTEDTSSGSSVYSYEITDSSGNSVEGPTVFNDGDEINFNGLTFDLAVPADITNANSITFNTSAEQRNILDVAIQAADALDQYADDTITENEFEELMDLSLDQLDTLAERNLEARTALGSRLSSLESLYESNEDFRLYTETTISALEDVDFAAAVSEFALEETVLQAAQATFAQVQQLTLFNYI